MEKVSIYNFYELGRLISKTENLTKEISNVSFYNHLTFITDTINEIDLPFSKKIIQNNLKFISKHFFELSGTKPKLKVDEEKFIQAIEKLKEIENSLKIELLDKFSYVPSNLKINLEYLTNRQDKLFDEGLIERKNLPIHILINIFQFGQCYAFSLFTAASIHILKATEEYTKYYYNELLENKLHYDELNNYTWNDILNNLKNILPENNKTKELIQILHIIKNNYRNETIHLNRMFTESETYELYNMCSKVVNQMNKDLNTLPNIMSANMAGKGI